MRAEVRAEKVLEVCVRCRCVRVFCDLRCAILVDMGADESRITEYVNNPG